MKFNSDIYFKEIANLSYWCTESSDYKKVLNILLKCYKQKGTVFMMGCGGSASTATHFAADLAKTCGGFKAVSLVDNIPLVSAYTNDCGWDSVFTGQLAHWITSKDVLVGFSVHGGTKKWSGNLTGAMKIAKARRAKIVGFSGFDGGEMKKMADVCLVVPTKSEIYGTPLVEAMHVVIAHSIVFQLKERLK